MLRSSFLYLVSLLCSFASAQSNQEIVFNVSHSRPSGQWLSVRANLNLVQSGTGYVIYSTSSASGPYYELSSSQSALSWECSRGSWTTNPGTINFTAGSRYFYLKIGTSYADANPKAPQVFEIVPSLGGSVSIVSETWNWIIEQLPHVTLAIDRASGIVTIDNPLILPDEDNDGIPDVFDTDDDGDGIPDSDDSDHPDYVPDLDNDGLPDADDNDRDGDGVLNDHDSDPDDPFVWQDVDTGDGGTDGGGGDGGTDGGGGDGGTDGGGGDGGTDGGGGDGGTDGGGGDGGGSGGGDPVVPGAGGNSAAMDSLEPAPHSYDDSGLLPEEGAEESIQSSIESIRASLEQIESFRLLSSGQIPRATSYTFSVSLGTFGQVTKVIDFNQPWWIAGRLALLAMITLSLGNALLKRITI